MNGRKWNQMNDQDYLGFIEYGMYDVFALTELYIIVQDIMEN